MLHDRHGRRRHIADRHVIGGVGGLHQLAPRVVERPEGHKPRFPVGSLPERRRRLPNPLPKSTGEGIRRIVTGIHRYVRDALRVPVGQPVRRPLHAGELDVAMHGEPEGCRGLPVEVIFREGCDPAHSVQVQVIFQMPVDVIQHPLHPGMVVVKRPLHLVLSFVATLARRSRIRRARPILQFKHSLLAFPAKGRVIEAVQAVPFGLVYWNCRYFG